MRNYYRSEAMDIGLWGNDLGLGSYPARTGELVSKLICHVHQFRERAGLHFRHYLAAMDFDSFLADAKFESNLFVKHAGDHQHHHFSLSRRQRIETRTQVREFSAVFSGTLIATNRERNGVEQILIAERLGEKLYRAGLHRLYRHRYIAVAGDKDDGIVNASLKQLLLQIEAAEPRQANIQNDAAGYVR